MQQGTAFVKREGVGYNKRGHAPHRDPEPEEAAMRKALYLLGQLSDADVEWMIAHGRRERVAAGTVLIREGQPVNAVYIVLDGVLEVTGSSVGGKVPLGCGEVVGEMSFIDARPPSATVTVRDAAVVLAIPRGAVGAAGA